LLTIKSEEGLSERLTEFAGLPEEMFENQVHKFSAIFSKLYWGPETVHAWSCCNWFLCIGKDMLENYVVLHLHLVTLSTKESWIYAQEALKYYASKLAQFRKTSTSRLLCLIKIYIFLRDARKNEFYAPKLQEKGTMRCWPRSWVWKLVEEQVRARARAAARNVYWIMEGELRNALSRVSQMGKPESEWHSS
jgi:hypothetical protein